MRWTREVLASFIFVIAFLFAAQMTFHSWGGNIFVSPNMYRSNPRSPAAIRKVFDFSSLSGNALTAALTNRLLAGVRVLQASGKVGIELGNFVTRNEKGDRVLACDLYDNVELKFIANGIAEDGEQPTMIVQTQCRLGENLNRIQPVWIPVKQILNKPAGDVDLSFNQGQPLHLEFQNMGPMWPKHWSLYSVRLYNSTQKDQQITVGPHSIGRYFARPVTLQL